MYRNDCKTCYNEAKKAKYKNSEELRNRFKINKEKAADRNREYTFSYLETHPCVDCGEPDLVVLEFDHVVGNKKASISYITKGAFSLESLKKEIAKCEVVCANCHRRRTAARDGRWRKRTYNKALSSSGKDTGLSFQVREFKSPQGH